MATKKRGLGKGLSALIPDEPNLDNIIGNEDNEKVVKIDISYIEPNSDQPRRSFNNDSLEELSISIKSHGVIQPIIVRKSGKGYQLVAGERRWRAAKLAGLKEIPCIVKDMEQIKSTEIALIENLQREDLNPIEEGLAYKNLMAKYELTQEEISDIVGKSRSYIANIVRLLNLADEVIEFIVKGDITSGHGRALLALEDKELQKKVAIEIIEKGLSVRQTEDLVKSIKNIKERPNNKKEKLKEPEVLEVEERLRKLFGTKVIINKGRNKGKIEIEYYNDDDLERILELLGN